jgi:restriction endonuclease S subunit
LFEIQIGYQIREKLDIEKTGTVQIIQAKDIDEKSGHRLRLDDLSRFTPQRSIDPYLVRNGEILVLSKGRRTFASVISDLPSEIPTVALYYFFILRPRTALIRPDFFAWAINETHLQDHIRGMSRGTGIPFVPKKVFSNLGLLVPPLGTQEVIVETFKLARRESALLRELASKRLELTRALCISAYEQEERWKK